MKLFLFLAAAISFSFSKSSSAFEVSDIVFQNLRDSKYSGPIQWRVGDHMEHQISMGLLGKLGTITSDVTSEEGNSVWLKQHTVLSMKDDVQELLVERSTGKVVKYLKNGQEATYDENPIQVQSQASESVTVPAGTFSCVHMNGKTSSGASISIWSNPELTAIDGMIKTVLNGSMTIELMKFSRGH